MSVRVRFAPSPTGYLHVGGARTALYNYLFAKKSNGKFILRIEDTDEERSTEESLKMVIEDLKWLGLDWDEGPDPSTLKDHGPYGPYRQSERKQIYAEVAQELIKKGKAYYCFLTNEEIDEQRESAVKAGPQSHVESPYQDWPLEKALAKIKEGTSAVVRFKTKGLKRDYVINDLVRGQVSFPSDMVGDFVLLRSGGMPVYNFCCVVDDYKMKISHVLRAEEHLPNTLRQMMIFEAMGWNAPEFGHLSLILDEDRKKLSKRKGATSCHEFRLEGYLPEALKNFVALLGWSPASGQEIVSETEMISQFETSRLHAAGAIFDSVKLKWMNANYLRATPEDVLWNLVEPFIQKENIKVPTDQEWRRQSLKAFKPAMETLVDAVGLYRLLDDQYYQISEESHEALNWEPTSQLLKVWVELLSAEKGETLSDPEFLKLQDRAKELTGA